MSIFIAATGKAKPLQGTLVPVKLQNHTLLRNLGQWTGAP